MLAKSAGPPHDWLEFARPPRPRLLSGSLVETGDVWTLLTCGHVLTRGRCPSLHVRTYTGVLPSLP